MPRHTTIQESQDPVNLGREPSARKKCGRLRMQRTSDAAPITHSCHHAARQRNGISATIVFPLAASCAARLTNGSSLRPYGGVSQIRDPGQSGNFKASLVNSFVRALFLSAAASKSNLNSRFSGSNISGGSRNTPIVRQVTFQMTWKLCRGLWLFLIVQPVIHPLRDLYRKVGG